MDVLSAQRGVLSIIEHVDGIDGAIIDPDGSSAVAYGDAWPGLRVLRRDGQAWQLGEVITGDSINHVAFSGDGNTLFLTGQNKAVSVYGRMNERWVKTYDVPGASRVETSDSEGSVVAQVMSERKVIFFMRNSSGWQKMQQITLASGTGKGIKNSPDGVELGGDGVRALVWFEEIYATWPRSILVFERTKSRFIYTTRLNFKSGIRRVNISVDEKTIIALTDDNEVIRIVYGDGTWRADETLNIPGATAISTTADGSETLVSRMDKTVSVVRW